MKTKEFIKRVKELGYNCFTNESYIFINKGYPWIATIALHRMYYMELWTNDNKLGELCLEYAKTPIEEREEEKKYYLRKFNKKFYENEYLNYNKYYKNWSLGDDIEDDQYQTKFTCSEIENIKKKFNTGLPEFARMVVE